MARERDRDAELVALTIRVPAGQARWLQSAADQTGQSQSELVQQAIQLLTKATSYKDEVR